MHIRNRLLAAGLMALFVFLACSSAVAEEEDLRARTLATGTQVLEGVTLTESTPLETVLADLDALDGQVVQVEGEVIAICQMMGCWIALEDADGNRLNVKVDDGVIDFRELTAEGRYIVAEGVVQKTGEHGAQIYIMEHGAVLSGD